MADKYSIVLDGGFREPLEQLAASLGYVWGERGNVREMIQAIAKGEVPVAGVTAFSANQRNALGRAAIAAYEKGNWNDALHLGEAFRVFQSEDEALNGYVLATLEPLSQPWALQFMECIEQQQPFKLVYEDAAGRPFRFSVCGAQFAAHERRIYLDCWCLETEDNQDLEELHNNWTLRLDRIVDAEIVPMQEHQWRSLSTVEVEFRLSGRLAYAYERRIEDTSIQWQEDIKIVRRDITNSFWFIREILRYGHNCEVVGPKDLRDRVKFEIENLQKTYER